MRERQLGEERLRVIAQPLDRLRDLVLRAPVLDAAGGDQPLDVARQLLDAVGADAEAEVLRRDVLELVRLVEDRAACTPESPRRTRSAGPPRRRTADDG